MFSRSFASTALWGVVFLILVAPVSLGSDTPDGNQTIGGVAIRSGVWKDQPVQYLDREILIGLKPDQSLRQVQGELDRLQLTVVRDIDRFGFFKVTAAGRDRFFETVEALEKLPMVAFAEPNLVEHECVIPNDPEFYRQWHYHNTGQDPPGGTVDADVDAVEGWDITTGSQPVLVGVLDGGLPFRYGQLSHPDLDDTTRFFMGYDFINGDFKPIDDRGHGTHVSGTIAAETDNGIGVSGLCWNAQILAVKVFDENGHGTFEAFRDGCIYAVDQGCRVINYSGGGSLSTVKEQGIAYADSMGVVVCAAAGNAYHGPVIWPAAFSVQYSNVIAVSATDHNDQLSPFSSLGPEVVVSAPGGYGGTRDENDVYSTFPNYRAGLNGVDTSGYGYLAGTSMATPHVAGLAALLISYEPDLSPPLVRAILCNSAEDLGPPGFDDQFGWGRINVYNALTELEQVTIVHDALPDTRDTLTDYEVRCGIISAPPLSGPPELHYKIGPSEASVFMEATGQPLEYRGYIPVQPAGTDIEYWMSAANDAGNSNVSDTFSFRVVSYGVQILPGQISGARPPGSLIQYPLWVLNDGLLSDTFDLNLTTGWSGTIYDASGITPITHTSRILPGESLKVIVEIAVPALPMGTVDDAQLQAASRGDVSRMATAAVASTVSSGVLSPPVTDDFFHVIDTSLWLQVYGCTGSNFGGFIRPTPSWVMTLNVDSLGGDTLKSQPIDFSGSDPVLLRFYLQQRATHDTDTLKIDFLDADFAWQNLHTIAGSPPYYVTDFELIEDELPASANHDAFQIRFTAGSQLAEQLQSWAIDDFEIGYLQDHHFRLTPRTQIGIALEGDTLRTMLTIQNLGVQSYRYDMTQVVSIGDWDATFWDETGSQQLSQTEPVAPSDSLRLMVKVAIPPDAGFTYRLIELEASPQNHPSTTRRSNIYAISSGEPRVLPYVDTFSTIGLSFPYYRNWIGGSHPWAPSPLDCLDIHSGIDTVLSFIFDLSAYPEAYFSYQYLKGGTFDEPEPGEDLRFEYRNSAGEWLPLSEHLGSDPNLLTFKVEAVALPADALHDQFQFRITANGSEPGDDHWLIDDLRITGSPPTVAVSPDSIELFLIRGDSATEQLVITNTGESVLSYSLAAVYESIQFESSDRQQGILATDAGSKAPLETVSGGLVKGMPDTRAGLPVDRNSGSASGYIWKDSDEPDGPTFQWIDIQSSGTPVSGLGDDNFAGPFPTGVFFPYFGAKITVFYVSSNGLLGLATSSYLESLDNQPIPYGYLPNGIIAWCWKDLDILDPANPGGSVYYRSEASRLIFQFVNYPEYHAEPGAVINAEVILESDGTITFQYLSIGSQFKTTDCTVGFEDRYGSDGVNVVFNNEYLHDSLAVQFIPSPGWLTLSVDTGSVSAGEADTVALQFSAVDRDSGFYHATLVVTTNDPQYASDPLAVPVVLEVDWDVPFLCGDFGLDGDVNVTDLAEMVSYFFLGGPPPPRPDAVDVDGSGEINVADLSYMVNYLFLGGPAPVCQAG